MKSNITNNSGGGGPSSSSSSNGGGRTVTVKVAVPINMWLTNKQLSSKTCIRTVI
jgi:hypothetical protein